MIQIERSDDDLSSFEIPSPCVSICGVVPQAGLNQSLVTDPYDGSAVVVPRFVGDLLDSCRSFRTLAEHRETFAKKVGNAAGQRESIEKVLVDCVSLGWIRFEGRLRKDAQIGAVGSSISSITSVSISTCGRPKSLRQNLRTLSLSLRDHGRKPTIRIIDDSRTEDVRRENQGIIDDMRRTFSFDYHYVGINERAELTQFLINKGVDPEIARFGLLDDCGCDYSAGRNRNAMLLSSIGELTLSLDDDCLFQFATFNPSAPELCVTSTFNPYELYFYSHQTELEQQQEFTDFDLLGAYEQVLGRDVKDIVGLSCSLGSSGPNPVRTSFLGTLDRAGRRISLSMTGIAGDCGYGTPLGYLTLTGESRDRFFASSNTYRSALRSRCVLAVSASRTLSDSHFFMPYAGGFDNRNGQVPFLPGGHNEDGFFGFLARTCFPSTATAHLPVAIRHRPDPEREFQDGALWKDAKKILLTDLIQSCIAASGAADRFVPGNHTEHIGCYLRAVSEGSVTDFWHMVRKCALESTARRLASWELFEQRFGFPEYAVSDFRCYLNCLRENLEDSRFPVPTEIRKASLKGGVESHVQCVFNRFGRLMIAWPEMAEIVKEGRAHLRFLRVGAC